MQQERQDSFGDEKERRRAKMPNKKKTRSATPIDGDGRRGPKLPIKGKRNRLDFFNEIDAADDDYEYPVR